jgi:hypothetical protein
MRVGFDGRPTRAFLALDSLLGECIHRGELWNIDSILHFRYPATERIRANSIGNETSLPTIAIQSR